MVRGRFPKVAATLAWATTMAGALVAHGTWGGRAWAGPIRAAAVGGTGGGGAYMPFRTGDVERDLPWIPPGQPGHDPGLVVILDGEGAARAGMPRESDVAQGPHMAGMSGWNMKDFRLRYDPDTDTLAVGVNFYGIAGDADGDGNPNTTNPAMLAAGGLDHPNFGGDESITVAFDFNGDGRMNLYAGIPADKTAAGPGPLGFTVAGPRPPEDAATRPKLGIQHQYGPTLPEHLGVLAFEPSADHPDFAFTINNFSQVPGVVRTLDGFPFRMRAYAGSVDDVGSGEDLFASEGFILVPDLPRPIPEPTTWLVWGIGIAAAIGARTRRSRERHRS